ncbi:MAG: L,D-transpeptidase [Thermomicrobiales bacterium]
MNRRRNWITLLIALALVIPAPLALVGAAPPTVVYFPATGHNLGGAFLTYWRAHGALPTFGYPLSEEFTEVSAEDAQPYLVQYFERARFEYHPENPAPWDVLLGHLGRALSAPLVKTPPFAPVPATSAPSGDDRAYFPETGHTLSHGFLAYWRRNGELPLFGYPLSEEFVEQSPTNGQPYTVQYFERARFEWHPENPEPYQVLLGHLGRQIAQARGVDTTAAPRAEGAPDYDDGLFVTPTPTRTGGSQGNPGRYIEVNLSRQHLYAWQGGEVLFDIAISSGRAGYETPSGNFTVIRKVAVEDMRGADYYQPDVPWIMYFTGAGHAIHGVYWHNNFGTPMSHGCVGAPVWAAQWLYNWGYVGLPIWIHY